MPEESLLLLVNEHLTDLFIWLSSALSGSDSPEEHLGLEFWDLEDPKTFKSHLLNLSIYTLKRNINNLPQWYATHLKSPCCSTGSHPWWSCNNTARWEGNDAEFPTFVSVLYMHICVHMWARVWVCMCACMCESTCRYKWYFQAHHIGGARVWFPAVSCKGNTFIQETTPHQTNWPEWQGKPSRNPQGLFWEELWTFVITKAEKITTVHLGALAVNGSFTLARGMEF